MWVTEWKVTSQSWLDAGREWMNETKRNENGRRSREGKSIRRERGGGKKTTDKSEDNAERKENDQWEKKTGRERKIGQTWEKWKGEEEEKKKERKRKKEEARVKRRVVRWNIMERYEGKRNFFFLASSVFARWKMTVKMTLSRVRSCSKR